MEGVVEGFVVGVVDGTVEGVVVVVARGEVVTPSYGGQVEISGISWFSQSVKWETSE